MFFSFSKIFEFLLMPVTWILVILIWGMFRQKSGFGRRLLISALTMLLFFTNPFIVNRVMNAWEVKPYSSGQIREPYDIGILLGGSMRYYNDVLERPVYSNSVDRLLQTIELYHEGKIRKVLLSGGSGRLSRPLEKESPIIQKVLVNGGVKPDDIILESESRNTRENALYSAEIIKKEYPGARTLLITSAWHMRRSVACFSAAGLDPVPFPVDERAGQGGWTPDRLIIPSVSSLQDWNTLIHEWFGCIMYELAGYI
jgi:uncharacterized SAM-binding protein YcdF (DUF218 family)